MNCCDFFPFFSKAPEQPLGPLNKGLFLEDSSSSESTVSTASDSPRPFRATIANILFSIQNPLQKSSDPITVYCKVFSATTAIAEEFFKKKSLSPEQFTNLCTFIEGEGRLYRRQAQQIKKSIYLSPKSIPLLPRAIQFNPNGAVLIHFSKLKQKDALIGRGAFKRVKLSWHFEKGVFAKHSCEVTPFEPMLALIQKENIENEIKMAALLGNYPGVCVLDPQSVTEVRKEDGTVKWRWITPFFNGEDLFSAVESKASPLLSMKEKLNIAKELCKTVRWLHEEKKILHRDIKLENILLNKNLDGSVKNVALSDWGAVTFLDDKDGLCKIKGTPSYTAPEICTIFRINQLQELPQLVSPSIDCWALGLVLYALFKRDVSLWRRIRAPIDYAGSLDDSAIYRLCSSLTEGWLPLPPDSEPIHEVIIGLLQVNPRNRMTARVAVERLNALA